MSSDLEDFLRRAAQRRAEAARARTQQTHSPRRTPQYTDRNRERRSAVEDEIENDDDEVVVAELVPQSPQPSPRDRPRDLDDQQRDLLHGLREGEVLHTVLGHEPEGTLGPPLQSTLGQLPTPVNGIHDPASQVETEEISSPTVEALLRLMTDPKGIHQAILAREILERPTHRW